MRDEWVRPLSSVDASFPQHYIFRSQFEGWAGRGGGSIMKLKSLISDPEISKTCTKNCRFSFADVILWDRNSIELCGHLDIYTDIKILLRTS